MSAFSQQQPALTVSEGARIVGTDKGTVSRILARLASAGLLERGRDGRSYHVGLTLFTLGQLYLLGNHVAKIATPRLAALARATRCGMQLAIRDGAQCVVIATASAPGSPRPPVGTEMRLPLHASAAGKVLLASLGDAELRQLVRGRRLVSYTGRTLTSFEALHQTVRVIRQRGYAVAEEEYFLGQHALAVPVMDPQARVAAALVAVSNERLDGSRRRDEVFGSLSAGAARLRDELTVAMEAHHGPRGRDAGRVRVK